MNLKALRCCVEIARLGSFTKAAQNLHIAQPALSMAVTRLEHELGVVLFNRSGRQVTVTDEGARFLARVETSLLGLDMARQELKDLTQLHSGEIRVGLPPMYGLNYFPALLAEFHRHYPGIVMTAVEGSADDISQRLESREIDVAMLESRRVDAAWDSVEVGADEMVLCMSPDHPLAGEPFLEAEQLRGREMLVFDRTFMQRHLLDEFCAARKVDYQIALQSNFVSLVIKSTQGGMGISTLLRSVQAREPGIVGVPFKPAQIMNFSLCWRANEYLSLANQLFIEFTKTRF